MHLLVQRPSLASLVTSGPEPPNSSCRFICREGERLPPSRSFQPAHVVSVMVGVCERREGEGMGGFLCLLWWGVYVFEEGGEGREGRERESGNGGEGR